MTPLAALFFPETSPQPELISQLLFFFDIIHHYQASEEPAPSPPKGWDERCPGYAPVPFHAELPRFNQLIRELKGNEGEFYSGQLSAMAARFTGASNEANVRGLISCISGRDSVNATDEAARKRKEETEDLWQARLLVKLAEILQEEERELSREMAAVAAREQELFAALKGDEEDEDEELDIALPRLAPSPASAIRPEPLVKAWAKLHLADSRRLEHRVLVCGREENAELLFEMNQSLSGRHPVRLLRIPLPVLNNLSTAAALELRNAFSRLAAKTKDDIARLLAECGGTSPQGETLQKSARLAADWTRTLAAFTAAHPVLAPMATGGECRPTPHLEIHLCANSSSDLLARLLRRPCPDSDARQIGALIAFLSTRSSTCKG